MVIDFSGTICNDVTVRPRFLTLADVAETLNVSASQAYALVRSGELPAIKVGGRGQWRVETAELEQYIQRMYAQTKDFISRNPEQEDSEDYEDAQESKRTTSIDDHMQVSESLSAPIDT